MQTIINILVFCLILGTIIMLHELGHFVTAKLFGVYCSEFSMGMGPKLFSKKIGETDYQLRLLPIGGYVAMAGEADQEDNEEMKDVPFERTLKGISTWKKCVVMLAGVFMNFVFSICLLFAVYCMVEVQVNSPEIGGIVSGAPAEMAGLQKGDVINKISVNDHEHIVASFTDVQTILAQETEHYSGKELPLTLEYTRGKKVMTTSLEAVYNEETNSFIMGIRPSTRHYTLFEAIKQACFQFYEFSVVIFATLGKLFTDLGNTVGQLSGPAGIYQVTAEVTSTGSISSILLLTALLSTNIGVFNLMPIPGLDGSQVLFALVEKLIRREIPVKLKYALQMVGLVLVFGLMIFVTINDIGKMF